MKLSPSSASASARLLLTPLWAGCLAAAPASAELVGAAVDLEVVWRGTDDGGAYTVPVFSGRVTVGEGAEVDAVPVARQNTNGGFGGASNRLDGRATVDVGAGGVTTSWAGQAQPGSLEVKLKMAPGGAAVLTGVTPAGASSLPGWLARPLAPRVESGFLDGAGIGFYGYQPGVEASLETGLASAPTDPVAAAFAGWQEAHFGAPGAPGSGAGDDPDGDGRSNRTEFAFGSDPNDRDDRPVTGVVAARGAGGEVGAPRFLELTLRLRRDLPASAYRVEVSDDMATWRSGPGAVAEVAREPSPGGAFDLVTFRSLQPLAAGALRAVRARFTGPVGGE